MPSADNAADNAAGTAAAGTVNTAAGNAANTAIYVFVHHRIAPRQADLLRGAYRQAVERLAGTAGLLGTELLVSSADRSRYVLLMHWDGRRAFRDWARRERELGYPSAMRPYQDRGRPGGHFDVYNDTTRVRELD